MALTPKQVRKLRRSDPRGGNRVAVAIRLTGLTQGQVADATGFTQPYLSNVSRGKYEGITVENAGKLAEFFGCAIEDLFPTKGAASAVAS